MCRYEPAMTTVERRDELLRRMQDELRGARGDRSLVEELIEERRREAAPEQAR